MRTNLRDGQKSLVKVDVAKHIEQQLAVVSAAGLIPRQISLSNIFLYVLKRQVLLAQRAESPVLHPELTEDEIETFQLTSFAGLPLHDGGPERYYKNRVTGTDPGEGLTLPMAIIYELPAWEQQGLPDPSEEAAELPAAESDENLAIDYAAAPALESLEEGTQTDDALQNATASTVEEMEETPEPETSTEVNDDTLESSMNEEAAQPEEMADDQPASDSDTENEDRSEKAQE